MTEGMHSYLGDIRFCAGAAECDATERNTIPCPTAKACREPNEG